MSASSSIRHDPAASQLLRRLSFESTPDLYRVRFAAPGIDKSALTITVMRTSATVRVDPGLKSRPPGKVVALWHKPPPGVQGQIQFADEICRRGHTAKLCGGVLTVEFRKEKLTEHPWAQVLAVE